MKKSLALLLALVMLFSLPACAESANTLETETAATATEENSAAASPTVSAAVTEAEDENPFADLVYQEGMALLQEEKYQEAYDDLTAAADAGSAAAMEALARGVILDKTLAEAESGDDDRLMALSRAFADKGDPWGLWTTAFLCMNGKGTGILRAGIQQDLRKNRHVKSFRRGVYGEGEDGVTVVTLR